MLCAAVSHAWCTCERDAPRRRMPRRSCKSCLVVQCIVLRDKEKVDASGQPRSRGCGFVEFESAEHALVCLRQMNNNPVLFGGPQRRPIVEFAIDSVRALKVQARKQRLIAERQTQRSLAEGAVSCMHGRGAPHLPAATSRWPPG